MISNITLKRLELDHYDIDYDKSYELYDQDTNNHTIILYLNKEVKTHCPSCSSQDTKSRGTRAITFKYSCPNEKNITMKLYRHIYKCNNCNHYHTQRNPFILEGRRNSIQTDLMILEALKDKARTYSSIAKEFGVSPTYVMYLFDKKVDVKRRTLPTVLAIDEVYSRRLTKTKYCCVLYDPRARKIIDVLDSRWKINLIDYFARITEKEKEKVLYVSIDMYKTYRDVIRLCLPYACVCVDSFHVIKALNFYFQKIRIRIMHKFEKYKYERSNFYWLLKKYPKFLLADKSNLPYGYIKVSKNGMTMSKDQIIDYCLSIDPELKLAYELKEAYREFNLTADIHNAEEKLDELIHEFRNSRISEYIPFWSMLLNWKTEIINSFNRFNGKRISNGPMERVNRDIKLIYNISFGSKNYERIRNRIMYTLNEDTPILGYTKKTTNKTTGKKRKPYRKNNK